MGLAKSAMVCILMMALCGVSMAGTVYKVGDSAGWTIIGHVDYKKWAASKNFQVGDTIIFEYHKEFHNVMQVTHSNFQSCNTTAPIAVYNTGNDSITIKRSGHFYFLCGIPGHCQAGQKVDIRVITASYQPPSSSPSPSPNTYASSPSAAPPEAMAPSPTKNTAASLLHYSKGLLGLTLVVLALCVSSGVAY